MTYQGGRPVLGTICNQNLKRSPDYIKRGVSRAIKAILRKEKLGTYALAQKLGTTGPMVYQWRAERTMPSLAWMVRILRRYPYAAKYLNWNVVRIDGLHDSKADNLGKDSIHSAVKLANRNQEGDDASEEKEGSD